jgi:hypothetical protein
VGGRLGRNAIETGLLRSLDLRDLPVVHHDLHDPETEALNLFADQAKPLGLAAGIWRLDRTHIESFFVETDPMCIDAIWFCKSFLE